MRQQGTGIERRGDDPGAAQRAGDGRYQGGAAELQSLLLNLAAAIRNRRGETGNLVDQIKAIAVSMEPTIARRILTAAIGAERLLQTSHRPAGRVREAAWTLETLSDEVGALAIMEPIEDENDYAPVRFILDYSRMTKGQISGLRKNPHIRRKKIRGRVCFNLRDISRYRSDLQCSAGDSPTLKRSSRGAGGELVGKVGE